MPNCCQYLQINMFQNPQTKNVSILLLSNIYNGNIKMFWHRKLCIKSWYSSNFFLNITDFSWITFWAKTLPILPDENLLIPLQQNVSILLESYMCNGNIGTFLDRKLCMTNWYSSQSFRKFPTSFVWNFGQNCVDTPHILLRMLKVLK